jgi:hypothetical protein
MPLFGGNAGQFAQVKRGEKFPRRVYRVIPGQVWWTLLHWPWRQYLAAVATGTPGVVPPRLASPGAAGVFVTDRLSLRGCESPADFAWRLSLTAQAQQECQIFGCAVIQFSLNESPQLVALPSLPGAVLGFTGNGAREWLVAGNIDLNASMRVDYIERTRTGSRTFRVPL